MNEFAYQKVLCTSYRTYSQNREIIEGRKIKMVNVQVLAKSLKQEFCFISIHKLSDHR